MKFSIVIPVYNVENYLQQCLDSVLTQKYQDYEVVLVDDGSTDSCPALCDQYQEDNKQIRTIHKENGGLSSARNAGIREAQGDYIILLDSDDFWNGDNVLQDISNVVEKRACDVVLFRCRAWNMKTNGSRVKISEYNFDILDQMNRDASVHYLLSKCQVPTGAYLLAVRKELLVRTGLTFIEGIKSEDYDWILSILRDCASIYATDGVHYTYRLGRVGSITNTVDYKHIEDLVQTVKKWENAPGVQSLYLRKDFLNYAAYIYSTALVLSARLRADERKKAIAALTPYKRVLKNGYWCKLRLISAFSKVFGISLTSTCLNLAYKAHLKHELS